MPKIPIDSLAVNESCSYPKRYRQICTGRSRKVLGDAVNLDQFGVNLARLEPGAASAQRHWHSKEDEFVFVVEGEVVLVEDTGESVLKAGEAAGFKAGVDNGHHLVNRSTAPAVYLEVGSRIAGDGCEYTDPNVDMRMREKDGQYIFTHADGQPFPDEEFE